MKIAWITHILKKSWHVCLTHKKVPLKNSKAQLPTSLHSDLRFSVIRSISPTYQIAFSALSHRMTSHWQANPRTPQSGRCSAGRATNYLLYRRSKAHVGLPKDTSSPFRALSTMRQLVYLRSQAAPMATVYKRGESTDTSRARASLLPRGGAHGFTNPDHSSQAAATRATSRT